MAQDQVTIIIGFGPPLRVGGPGEPPADMHSFVAALKDSYAITEVYGSHSSKTRRRKPRTVTGMPRDIYASMRYHDATAAIDWLERAFGFERQVVYDGPEGTIAHAELRHGRGLVMLGSWRGDDDLRRPGQGWAYVAVDDLDSHHRHASAEGAEIVDGPQTQDYGSFYSARDPEGNLWSFGTYGPEVTHS